MAPLVYDKVQVVFQEDATPGTGSSDENSIDYMDFDKGIFVGMPGENKNPGFEVSNNYPNPAVQFTRVTVRLDKAANVIITITSITNQTLQYRDIELMDPGNNQILLDLSGLAAGVYFYSVQAGDQKVTRKMVICLSHF